MSGLEFDSECLLCPKCGGIHLHSADVDAYDRVEDATEGRHVRVSGGVGGKVVVDGDMAGNPSQRRYGICVSFWCELCGSKPVLTIVQHKGSTHLNWR